MEVLKYRIDGTSEWKDIIALQGKPGEKGKPFEYKDFTPEQLESLVGPKGEPGKDGLNGYTPIRGTDYWTKEDIEVIEKHCNSYINSQLGTINEQLASLTEVE